MCEFGFCDLVLFVVWVLIVLWFCGMWFCGFSVSVVERRCVPTQYQEQPPGIAPSSIRRNYPMPQAVPGTTPVSTRNFPRQCQELFWAATGTIQAVPGTTPRTYPKQCQELSQAVPATKLKVSETYPGSTQAVSGTTQGSARKYLKQYQERPQTVPAAIPEPTPKQYHKQPR